MLEISEIPLGAGRIAICPLPGRGGDYAGDLDRIVGWEPALVVSLTTAIELEATGADRLPADLREAGIGWRHFPVNDFRAPCSQACAEWPELSVAIHTALSRGERVLVHCYGGCGRSGMTALRLMVEAGEHPEAALERLRQVRPCAVETGAQEAWAAAACTAPGRGAAAMRLHAAE